MEHLLFKFLEYKYTSGNLHKKVSATARTTTGTIESRFKGEYRTAWYIGKLPTHSFRGKMHGISMFNRDTVNRDSTALSFTWQFLDNSLVLGTS